MGKIIRQWRILGHLQIGMKLLSLNIKILPMKQLTLLFIAISFQVCGQDTLINTEKPEIKRWHIGVEVSPDLCYRKLQNPDGNSYYPAEMGLRDSLEIPKFGYTAGPAVAFSLSSHWTIGTGLLFSNKGYKTKNMDISESDFDKNGNGIYIYGKAKIYYSFYYLDVPLKVNYACGHGKIRFCASLGIITNIFLFEKRTIIMDFDDGEKERVKITDSGSCKSVNISPMGGLGLDWAFTKRMNLRIEPTFRYGMLKINDEYINTYLWNAGLNFSYYYSIR
jgi:hypothetical protein